MEDASVDECETMAVNFTGYALVSDISPLMFGVYGLVGTLQWDVRRRASLFAPEHGHLRIECTISKRTSPPVHHRIPAAETAVGDHAADAPDGVLKTRFTTGDDPIRLAPDDTLVVGSAGRSFRTHRADRRHAAANTDETPETEPIERSTDHRTRTMTDSIASQMTVECTECEFSQTLTRSDDGWSAADVTEHAERTGHRLRATPVNR